MQISEKPNKSTKSADSPLVKLPSVSHFLAAEPGLTGDCQGSFSRVTARIRNPEKTIPNTVFDRRRAITELIAEYNSVKTFQASLLIARKNLAARYLKRPRAGLKLPDVEQCRNAFWRMVSGTVELVLEE